jgi:transmembrane sensor
LEKEMTQELLNRFLNDQCNEEELQKVIKWIKMDALNSDGRILVSADWKNFQEDSRSPDKELYNIILHKIHRKIIADNQIENRPGLWITSWLMKAAAILLLPVLGLLFYMLFNHQVEFTQSADLTTDSLQIVTPIGSRTTLQLPDGSEVFLNHGSSLKYPQRFAGKKREVVLSGEGYFIVAHDADKPFYVKTERLEIKALGTEFNVSAYPGDELVATTLVNGKVIIEQPFPDGRVISLASMVPGQYVAYNTETGRISTVAGKIERYIAWKEGKLLFDNESILRVANELSRMFNVDIVVSDDIKGFTYTVTFVDEPLFQILDLMKIATPITYKIHPRKKLPDGSFSRQKIVIEKRI